MLQVSDYLLHQMLVSKFQYILFLWIGYVLIYRDPSFWWQHPLTETLFPQLWWQHSSLKAT